MERDSKKEATVAPEAPEAPGAPVKRHRSKRSGVKNVKEEEPHPYPFQIIVDSNRRTCVISVSRCHSMEVAFKCTLILFRLAWNFRSHVVFWGLVVAISKIL